MKINTKNQWFVFTTNTISLFVGAFALWVFNNLKCDKTFIELTPIKVSILENTKGFKGVLFYKVITMSSKKINFDFSQVNLEFPEIDKRIFNINAYSTLNIYGDTLLCDSIIFEMPETFNDKQINRIPELKKIEIKGFINGESKTFVFSNVQYQYGIINPINLQTPPPGIIKKEKSDSICIVVKKVGIIYRGKQYYCNFWPPNINNIKYRIENDTIYFDYTFENEKPTMLDDGSFYSSLYDVQIDAPNDIKHKIKLPKINKITLYAEARSKHEITVRKFEIPLGKKCLFYIFEK